MNGSDWLWVFAHGDLGGHPALASMVNRGILDGSGGLIAAGWWGLIGTGLALAGLFGLATDHEPTEGLSELLAKVERLAAGEYGVDFSTDSEGELGQLSEELDRLATRLQHRESVAAERRSHRLLLEMIIENTENPIYLKDRDGVYQFVNEAAADVFGGKPAEIVGKTDADLFHPDSLDEVREGDKQVIERNEPVSRETEVIVDDERRVFFNDKYPYRDEDGAVQGVLGISHDVTERRAREEELEQYREYTDDVLDAIDDVFYVLDEDGTLLRWNEAFTDVNGYTEEEVEGSHALEFFPEDEHDRIVAAIEGVFETGEVRIESELLTKDGTRIPYEFIAAQLEDPEGNSVLTGIGRDITDRREHERKLRERERELSTLMDNIPGMVYQCRNEPDWPFEFVSNGSREVTGYDPDVLESGELTWGEEVIVDDNDEIWEAVQRAIENREPFRLTYQIETADGDRRWVWEQGRGVYDEDGTLEALEGVILDITDQKEREAELERTKDFLEHTQRIASVGGWELDLRGGPPYDGDFTDELYRIHELPVGTDMDMETGLEYYHPDHRDRVQEAVQNAIETGERYDVEALLVTAEGNERWVQTTGVPIYEDDELVKLRGALQDITERKERELALESLQETAQRLLGTETESDVADLVVDSAAEFLDTSCLALYLLDNETNHLEPVAYSPTFAQRCGNMEAVSIEQDNSILWDAFVNGERITVDAEMADESPVFEPAIEGGLVVPIADYGVFVVSTPDPPVDNETERLVETLVATTEAALDRLESETLLRERESELATRNQRLRRQMQVNDIIRSTHTSLIGADSRTEIEETVCERLVEAEHVRFAWLGGFDAGDTEMEVRAWAGTGQDYLDDLPLAVDGGNEPSLVTARTGEPTVVENVIDDLDTAQWRQDALLREFHSVVSVPLSFDEFSVGILTVYADEPNAFGDLEETVFTELGESIAHSIVGVNTRQALHAETLVELTVQLTSDSFFTRIARDGDCQVQYEGLASYSGQGSRLFFTTVGAEAETVLDVLADLVSVTDARLVSTFEDECLFEVTVTDETIPVRLARHGGRLRSVQVVDDVLELVVDVPRTTDVREFLDMLEEEYASVELLGRRDVERSIQTRQEFLDYLLEELTDRQREVLRTAYYAGFFEWPRASTGEDIAEMLGVTQPTVNRHLRLGQQRLLEALFEHPVSDRD